MSNIYNLEPKTSGLINLRTDFGDIEIELFTKECPKATRNFVQNCLNGFYNGKSFERIEKDFIAVINLSNDQDPCEPFKDEFHPRLKFNRRGLLATANTKKDANFSKFFFTLGSTPELQNKHTIFGRARGNSVYKLVDLNECPVDDDLRPIGDKKILETVVVENPYPDLKPDSRASRGDHTQVPRDEYDDYDPILKPRPKIGHSKKLSYSSEEDDDEISDNDRVRSAIKPKQKLENDRDQGVSELESDGDDIKNANSPNKRAKLERQEPDSKETANERELRLRAIRQQIEDLKKKFENDSQTKSLSERRRERSTNSSIESSRQALDSSQSGESVDFKNSSSISVKKKEMIEDFNRKLEQAVTNSRSHQGPGREDSLKQQEEEILDGDDWMNHTLEFPPDEEDEDAYSVLDSLKKQSAEDEIEQVDNGESLARQRAVADKEHRSKSHRDRNRDRDDDDDAYDRRHRRDESRTSDRKRHKHSRRHSSDRYYGDDDDHHHHRHRHHHRVN